MSSRIPSLQVETVPSSQKGLDEQKSKLVPTHRTASGNHHQYIEGSITVEADIQLSVKELDDSMERKYRL